jgi:hypothetical protein
MSEEQTVDERLTNQKFSEKNVEFLTACVEADVKSTSRQASKWRNKKGKVYKTKYISS